MTLKKTVFSNIAWIFYSLVVFTFSMFIFTRGASYFLVDSGVGIVALVLFFGLTVLFILLATLRSRKEEKNSEDTLSTKKYISKKTQKILNIVTYAVSGAFIAGGIYLRLNVLFKPEYLLQIQNNVLTPFYPTQLPGINTVSDGIYYSFLEFLFFVFGNYGETVLIVNMVLIVLNTVILFFAMKKLLGDFGAISVTGFLSLSPFMMRSCVDSGPELLSLTFMSLALLFMSEVLPLEKIGIATTALWGAFAGIYIAVDAQGFALLLGLPLVFMVSEPAEKNIGKLSARIKKGLFCILIFAGFTVIGFAFAMIVYSGITGLSLSQVLVSYPVGLRLFGNRVCMPEKVDLISGSVIAVLSLIGITAGFLRKKYDQGISVSLILLGIFVFELLGLSGIPGGVGISLFVLMAALSGHSIENLIRRGRYPEEDRIFEKSKRSIPGLPTRVKDGEIKHNVLPGQPLDNPLPVPERKEHKTMDYDYYVSESADYDY